LRQSQVELRDPPEHPSPAGVGDVQVQSALDIGRVRARRERHSAYAEQAVGPQPVGSRDGPLAGESQEPLMRLVDGVQPAVLGVEGEAGQSPAVADVQRDPAGRETAGRARDCDQ
jgi:hypothetical protein